MTGSQKRKRKMKGKKSTLSLNPLEITSARKEGLATMVCVCVCLCVHLYDQKQQSVMRTQIPPYLKDRVLTAQPGAHKLHVNCSKNMCTAACHRAGGWGMGSCYQTGSWNGLKLNAIYHPTLPLELQAFNRLQFYNSYIRQILPVQLLSSRKWIPGASYSVIFLPLSVFGRACERFMLLL